MEKESLVKFIEENKEAVFYLPTIVLVEFLAYKKLDERTSHLFEEFLKDIVVINLDIEIARMAAKIRRIYNLKTIDAVVAASAIITNSTLITYNLKDFKRIKELKVVAP